MYGERRCRGRIPGLGYFYAARLHYGQIYPHFRPAQRSSTTGLLKPPTICATPCSEPSATFSGTRKNPKPHAAFFVIIMSNYLCAYIYRPRDSSGPAERLDCSAAAHGLTRPVRDKIINDSLKFGLNSLKVLKRNFRLDTRVMQLTLTMDSERL